MDATGEGEGEGEGAALPVVFALHDPGGTYWLNTAVAMTSVIQHASRPVSLHIVHDASLGETPRRRLAEIARSLDAPLEFIERALPEGIDPASLGKFSPASLFRLMIPALFGEADLVVYLDSDLVLNGVDIHDLRAAAPPEAPLCAVVDLFMMRGVAQAQYVRDLGLDPDAYFNSGVLALRPKLIASDLLAEFADFVRARPKLAHPDQDFLNRRFRGSVALVDQRFNSVTTLFDNGLTRPLGFYANKVLHYAGEVKPLDGVVAPAFLPFLAHALLVPEVYGGQSYDAKSYLFPMEGRPDLGRGLPVDRDPRAAQPSGRG